MNKASWMSGFASIIGVIGIGFGFWWADALVGILVSFSITKDGFTNVKQSIFDMLDEVPKTLDGDKTDPLIVEVKELLLRENWISNACIRLRDEGHVFFGDIAIEIKDKTISPDKLLKLREKLQNFHWRLHDIVIMPI